MAPSRGAPQNTIDHPDLFHSPDISARGPQETDSFTNTAPSTPLMNHHTSARPPPNGPQDRSPDVSSTTVSLHTQPVEQQGGWDSSAFIAPPSQSQSLGQSNYYAYSNNQSTTVVPPPSRPPPPGATIIEPVASYTFNGSAYVDDATYQTYPQQQPIPNYYQQELNQQQYQTAYTQPVYQDPYLQQQQYHHQEYSEPDLVDTIEKVDYTNDQDSSLEKNSTSTGKRKRLYWIGGVVIIILAGVLVGLLVSMKNKDSSNNNNSSNSNSSSGSGAGATGSNTSRSSPTWSTGGGGSVSNPTGTPAGTPTLSNVVGPTGGPVVVPPLPTTSSGGEQPPVVNPPPQTNPPPTTPPEEKTTTTTTTTTEPPKPTSGGGDFGPRISTPPLPSLPPKGQCGILWCDQNYLWWCRDDICSKDGEMKACKAGCTDQFCPLACESENACNQGCMGNYNTCENHCRP